MNTKERNSFQMMMTDARCSVCSAPLLNTQKWPATKTRTIRSPSAKRSPSRSKAVVQQTIEDEYIKQLQEQIYVLENENQYLYPFSSRFLFDYIIEFLCSLTLDIRVSS